MTGDVFTALISGASALAVAAVGYYLTKKQDREAGWRKEKLVFYKEFIGSLSSILEGESTPEGQLAFSKACNDLLLFAPQSVIVGLRAFQNETRVSNVNKSREHHDKLLSKLLLEIRSDIGVKPTDDPATFEVSLWASGVKYKTKGEN